MTSAASSRGPQLVCRCREVTEEEVLAAIEDGARSVRGVKLRTLATTGLCQGHTCAPLIESILQRVLGEEYVPDERTARAPVRPIPLRALAGPSARKTSAEERR